MPRAPDKRISQAYELYNQGMKLVEIASQLNIPEGTIRRWKHTYKWESERSKKNNERSKQKGGQKGNKNAVGHGGTGPPNNKNAVKTGEFETLFFDTLDEKEKRLIQSVQLEKQQLLLQEIQLLTVRERRMLQRIEELKHYDFTKVKKKKGTEKDKWTELDEEHATLGQIQSVEDALTRVQARKQRAIETIHKFDFDDSHIEIELMRLELQIASKDTSSDSQENDGFMEALNSSAAEVWSEIDVD